MQKAKGSIRSKAKFGEELYISYEVGNRDTSFHQQQRFFYQQD